MEICLSVLDTDFLPRNVAKKNKTSLSPLSNQEMVISGLGWTT